MTEFRKTRDYKERFEFKLTVDNNIICQRYFRINNFNPISLKSHNLSDVITDCVNRIDNDLKDKSLTYLEVFAPMYFDSLEAMEKYFANPFNRNRMNLGHGIVVKGHPVDFAWTNNGPKALDFKFDDGELYENKDNKSVTYKFAFLVDEKEICSRIWEGTYPKYIRNSIDLSNKKGKQDEKDISNLNFEQYLDYQIVKGKTDLVWGLIKDICTVCSYPDNNDYVLDDVYGDIVYKNVQSDEELFKIYGLTKDGMNKVNTSRR